MEKIEDNWFYEDQTTINEYNKRFQKKSKYVNPAKIHEISCYYLIGLQGSGKSTFIKQYIENNFKKGNEKGDGTIIYYISSLADVPKFIQDLEKDTKKTPGEIQLFNDEHFTNHTLFNPFLAILEDIKKREEEKKKEKELEHSKKQISSDTKLTVEQVMLRTYGNKFKMPKEKESENDEETKKLTHVPYILVVDDMIFKNEFKNDIYYIEMLKCYRHWNLSILISTQSLVIENQLGVRKLFETYVVYNSLNNKELVNIYEESSLPCTLKEFINLYQTKLIGKHDYFLIDKTVFPQLFIVQHEFKDKEKDQESKTTYRYIFESEEEKTKTEND